MKRLKNKIKVMDLSKVDGAAVILARTTDATITTEMQTQISLRDRVSRVKRPALFEFLLGSGFNDLDPVPAGAIKTRTPGFKVAVLPEVDQGRKFSPESVRLWIYQHMTNGNDTNEIREMRDTFRIYIGATE